MKRKVIAVLLAVAVFGSMSGCSSSSKEVDKKEKKTDTASEDKKEKEEKKQPQDITGQWKCVDAATDPDGSGTELSAEDMESAFDMDMTKGCSFQAWKNRECELIRSSVMGVSLEEAEEIEEETSSEEEIEVLELIWSKNEDEYVLSGSEDKMRAWLDKDRLVVQIDVPFENEGTTSYGYEKYYFEYQGETGAGIRDFYPDDTAESTRQMSNYMNEGRSVIVDGKYLYGMSSDGYVGFAEITAGKDKVSIKNEKNLLEEDGYVDSMYYQQSGKYVYCFYSREEDSGVLKINTKDQKVEKIYDKWLSYMQILNDRIYFTDENNEYCSMDLDGKDKKTELKGKKIYYPYQFGDGWMLFQDDADGEKLHLMNQKLGIEKTITDAVSYRPIAGDGYIYYMVPTSTEDNNETYYLARVSIRTWENEISPYEFDGNYYIEGEHLWIDGICYPLTSWNEDCDSNPLMPDYAMLYSDGTFRNVGYTYGLWNETEWDGSNSVGFLVNN